MKVRDLLAMPELQLRLLYGDDSSLDRPLSSTYSSDLLDPGRYLHGGELIVSGLMWRTSPADSEVFAANLATAGAAGLAAGEVVFGEVPQDVVDAFKKHDMVLLGVPGEVSFSDINEAVIGASSAERRARLEATLGRHRKLLAAVAQGGNLDELIEEVTSETDLACRVITPTGRHIGGERSLLPPDVLDRLTWSFLTVASLPQTITITGQPPYSIFGVGPGLGQRAQTWMVLVDSDHTTWKASSLEAVNELAAIAQLQRGRREESLHARSEIAQDAMNLVMAGAGNHTETGVRLRQAGLDPTHKLSVVVCGCNAFPWQEGRVIVDDITSHLGPSVVAQGPDDQIVALVSAGATDFADRLRTAIMRLAPGLRRTPMSFGISEPAALSALSGGWEEACHAQRLAELTGESVSVVDGREVTSHVLLLATVPDDVRRAYSARALGAVLDYDQAHHARLMETLEAFLATSCSWSRTAENLHLHVNTVRYRIQRVEELTGRDLSQMADRVDIFLALRSLP